MPLLHDALQLLKREKHQENKPLMPAEYQIFYFKSMCFNKCTIYHRK